MKKILFIFIAVLISVTAFADKWYLAPTTATPAGSDVTGTGLIGAPYWSLEKVWTDTISSGDTIYLRGGIYEYSDNQILSGKNGSVENLIKVWAYPGESPIITKAGIFTYATYYAGITLSGNYFHWKGIEIKGFVQEANDNYLGFYARNVSYSIFEDLNIHHNGCGMILREVSGTSTGNLILNCDFHHNYDPLTSPIAYGNADGLDVSSMTNKTSTNTVRGCRFWYNSDDGLDCWDNEGYVTIDNCWSWANGYREDKSTHGGDGNGLKLGETTTDSLVFARTITNNLVFNNYGAGITQNGCGKRMYLYNNTAYSNARGIAFASDYGDAAMIIRNNIAYDNPSYNFGMSGMILPIVDHNSWSGFTVTDDDFVSVDSTGVSGARGSDGSLPDIDYMKLVSGSDMEDAGVYVDISYIGSAPDLGFFEVGSDVDPPTWNPTGIGWDRMQKKVNFRDSINFTRGFMIAGVPISSSGSGLEILGGLEASVNDLNATTGATGNFQGQINAIEASTVDDSKADTSLSNLGGAGIAVISGIIHDSLTAVLNNADDGITVTDTADMLAPYALLSEVGESGLSSGDVAAQINDTIEARLSVAVPGVRVSDTASMLSPYALLSEVSGGGITASDTADMLAPYFTESEIRKVNSDTIPLFIFGTGSGATADTALFNNNRLIGSFYNSGSDTLHITELRGVMKEGTGTETIAVQISWDVNLLDDTPVNLNSSAVTITSLTGGTTDTSFNGNDIPPGVWVWGILSGASTNNKPTYLCVTLTGYKRNRSY